MPKYQFEWTTENWHRTIIEADNEDEASQKFWEESIFADDSTIYDGDYVQENIEIEEVE